MTARILAGKTIAESINSETALRIVDFIRTYAVAPCLAAVRVGDDPASSIYVANKVRTAADMGLVSEHHHLPSDISQAELLALIRKLNSRDDVDGILVQLPLPQQINERQVLESIEPVKDVDGFHPTNVGLLSLGYPGPVPCTPAGVIEILKRSDIPIAGKHAVIVGRSNIVGKPMAMLLLRENATVTVCHSRTTNLEIITRQADILVAAIGRPGFIRGDHIKEGATVIDVGINQISDERAAIDLFEGEQLEKRQKTIVDRGFTLVGDVNPKEAVKQAGNFTPVPGGVGLLTVAMLMKNTVDAAIARRTKV